MFFVVLHLGHTVSCWRHEMKIFNLSRFICDFPHFVFWYYQLGFISWALYLGSMHTPQHRQLLKCLKSVFSRSILKCTHRRGKGVWNGYIWYLVFKCALPRYEAYFRSYNDKLVH